MHNHYERPSQRNKSRPWSAFFQMPERCSDMHGTHRYGPRPTTHPSSDGQRHIRRICQLQHPPKAFKSHRHALLLSQGQILTRTVSGVLYGWRTQSIRIFYQAPPHQPPSITVEHIYSPDSRRQQVCMLHVTYLPVRLCLIPLRPRKIDDGHTHYYSYVRRKRMMGGKRQTCQIGTHGIGRYYKGLIGI